MNKTLLLIDSHVHIHQCYNLDEYLASTFSNFSSFANGIENGKDWIGVLFLTEIEGVNYFNLIKSSDAKIDSTKFVVYKTIEDNSVIISNRSEQKIILIAGRQIIAKDGIEVLAVGITKDCSSGKSLDITIDEINSKGGIPILPWGVGKWLGKSKKVIKKFIENNKNKNFFLGDNSSRPKLWLEPDIFELGRKSNHFVLPGTDSLAIQSEVNKTGTYGFILNTEINLNEPTEDLLVQISNLKFQPKSFGKLETLLKFFKNQIIMQINKQSK